jgi:DNA polymerase III subunit beta
MKFTIERAALLKSLGHVQSVVERRNTIPILSNVLLDASDGKLHLTATDLDLAMVETTDADVDQPGAVTAPAHMLYDIVRKLPDGSQVAFQLNPDDARLAVTSGRSRFALASLPREDFPVLSDGDMAHKFTLDPADLIKLIDRTRFAISTEETRYYLMGIYFHVAESAGKETLRGVATDGHRLARVDLPAPKGAKGMPGVIIPRKAVNEVYKLMTESDSPVTIQLSDTKIRFTTGHAVLTSKLIDGTFPDYTRVIPETNDKILEADTKQLAEAVDRVSTVSSEKSRAVKMGLDKDKMTLSVTSPDSGSATEELAVTYDSGPMEIGFNAKYILDIVSQIESDTTRLQLSDATAPTIIRDAEASGTLYVLMPMRV